MALFDSIGEKSTKQLVEALPGVEKTITDSVGAVQELVKQTLVPILVDVVDTVVGQVDRIGTAKITILPSEELSVTVKIPTFTVEVKF